jgi:hypothetical protein
VQGAAATLLSRLDREIAQAKVRFGPKNPLLTFLIQAKLAVFVRDACTGESVARAALIEVIALLSELQFDVSTVKIGISQPPLPQIAAYEFPRRDFDQNYADTVQLWRESVLSKPRWSLEHEGLQARFIYVIGPKGEWRYFPVPQPIDLCITRRNDSRVFPFHPMLALDFDLCVAVAGEISFHWQRGSASPQAIYVNNVSGHFRPDGWSAIALDALVRSSLGLPKCTSVIAVANDGAHVTGRLARLLR